MTAQPPERPASYASYKTARRAAVYRSATQASEQYPCRLAGANRLLRGYRAGRTSPRRVGHRSGELGSDDGAEQTRWVQSPAQQDPAALARGRLSGSPTVLRAQRAGLARTR